MSSMLTFTKDEDGDIPQLGQFTQQSMSPYIEQFRMFAAAFAGETGLTMDDLGFVSDNPLRQHMKICGWRHGRHSETLALDF